MKNVWRKLRDNWLDFWEDDELDMDKKHLSQHDKRSLLYGGFMIGAVTFVFLSIGIMVGNIWTNHRNQKDMQELLGTIATYMATATDDEYEEIAQTIRHDLVYSQYGQDITHSVKSGTKFPLCFPQILPLVFGISRLFPSATSPGGVFTARVVLHLPLPPSKNPQQACVRPAGGSSAERGDRWSAFLHHRFVFLQGVVPLGVVLIVSVVGEQAGFLQPAGQVVGDLHRPEVV